MSITTLHFSKQTMVHSTRDQLQCDTTLSFSRDTMLHCSRDNV